MTDQETFPNLSALRCVTSLREFAPLVGFIPKGLSYTIYKIPQDERYRIFTIPKRSGGERTISAPQQQLALLQKNLARLITDCVDEIESQNIYRKNISHGFHKNRSIVTNARSHRKRRYVLNVDLEDFFPSINFGRVRGYFIHDHNFRLHPKIATIIAQITCHNNSLPQGSPSSPIISNLIGHILDSRLARLAKTHGSHYTRYADDLTFSTNARAFPPQLALPHPDATNNWIIGESLNAAIERTGFFVNTAKIRMQIRGSRQDVTGLIVNEKINTKAEYYRTVRSMCSSLFRTGQYFVPKYNNGNEDQFEYTENIAPLEGRLSHIYYVKSRRDLSPRVRKEIRFSCSESFLKLYRRFLFFKYFVSSPIPVVVTEGKTDIIYIRCAISQSHNRFPTLVRGVDDEAQPNTRFVWPSYVNKNVLNLGDGYGGIIHLLNNYVRSLRDYTYAPLSSPVIIVVDNDDGGKKVFQSIKSNYRLDISISSDEEFFHITHNLYLLKTPSIDGGTSCMESLFPEEILGTIIDGKTFDINKAHGDDTTYGKYIFSDRVIRPNANAIDFTRFHPLLSGMEASIRHHSDLLARRNAIAPDVAIEAHASGS